MDKNTDQKPRPSLRSTSSLSSIEEDRAIGFTTTEPVKSKPPKPPLKRGSNSLNFANVLAALKEAQDKVASDPEAGF